MDQDGVEVPKMKPITSHLGRTRLVNKQFIWLSGKYFLWDMVGSPKWARSTIFPTRVANESQCRILVILPTDGANHILIIITMFPQDIHSATLQIPGEFYEHL